jgi:acetaldehyde dehydrogenase/alcohol dehydrogenase
MSPHDNTYPSSGERDTMWYFYSPTIVFGEGALDHVETIEGNRWFIVTDPGIRDAGLLDILTHKLDELKKEWKAFTEVEPDPREETIYEAARHCRAFNPEVIAGIGGGSSLDVAKGVWVFYEHPEFETVDEIHPFQKMAMGRRAVLVAIPTTSGTGADTTWAIVVTRRTDGQQVKLEQVNKAVIPTYAIIDPIFPRGMPASLTCATGFDALGHSLEGLISTWENPFSDAFAIQATRLIFEYLPMVVKDGNDMQAREQMHNAATMAGLAFGNSQVIMGHSMAHALGAVLHIPHGNAVGLCLPPTMHYCIRDPESTAAVDKCALVAKSIGLTTWESDNRTAADTLVKRVKLLQEETGLPTSLKAMGISRDLFEEKKNAIVDQCMESPSAVMTPRSIGEKEFAHIVDSLYSGGG